MLNASHESFPNLRELYKPVQPAIKKTADQVVYIEFFPDSRLVKFIHCYWQLKTVKPLTEPFFYKVVADGCIDIFFEVDNPEDNYIMGFSSTYIEFPLATTFNYVGTRFLPAAFPFLFQINASALTNRFESLKAVLPEVSVQLSALFQKPVQASQYKALLDTYFLNIAVNAAATIDHRVFDAIAIILKQQGVIQVQKQIDTGISQRQLRRLFEFYIGVTPKTFSKVVRFQNILQAKPSVESLRKSKIFFDIGYYDQAHFIKEFKTLAGLTPVKTFEL